MSVSRLPGVQFETATPPLPEALPRMDIPAFVGFAASGPLDVPVAVEEADCFHEIFGDDLALAWDVERGEMAYAQLSPAVRAFFRNGGRRCWAVRVADNATARSNEFMIPGLLRAVDRKSYQAAWAEARSPGSWSDDRMVNAALSSIPVEVESVQDTGSAYVIALPAGVHSPATAGDMLRLVFPGSQASPPAPADAVLYLPIESVTTRRVDQPPGQPPQQGNVLSADRGFWFQPATPQDLQPESSPPVSGVVSWLEPPRAAYWLTLRSNPDGSRSRPEDVALTVRGWGLGAGNEFVLDMLRQETRAIAPGSWLRLEFDSQLMPPGATALLFQVGGIRGSPDESSAALSSPSGDEETALVVAASAWWTLDEEQARSRYTTAPEVTLLSLELYVRDARGAVSRLPRLRLALPHPRYWGCLPTDVQLFRASDKPGPAPGSALRQEVSHPRFPLAAPDDGLNSAIYIPLGIRGSPQENFYQTAVSQTGSKLERDGLAPPQAEGCPSFSADFFLDPDLEGSGVATLLTEAFHKQYQLRRGNQRGPLGEPLLKMHAVIPLQEVSLLAVPDATHRGWVASAGEMELLYPPQMLGISAPDAEGTATVSWTKVSGAESYVLQVSTDPQFESLQSAWEGLRELSTTLPRADGCPVRRYFRVRAVGEPGVSPWSNSTAESLPVESFEVCNPPAVDAPVLAWPAEARGLVVLQWSTPAADIDRFKLEVAGEPTFELPQVLYEGGRSRFEVWKQPTGVSYFRVSAERHGDKSPWSNTVFPTPANGASRWEMVRYTGEAQGDCEKELRRIHQAMLRLCAARSDLLAVLSLPREYRTAAALDYKDRLVSLLAPEEPERTLSFGALYHPWSLVRDALDDSSRAVRAVAPEGTVCGSMASRTLTSGAWASPANQRLRGVVALEPGRLEDGIRQAFFDGQINLLQQDARGFTCFSSCTLSTDREVREISVRRLLILLRRLALREGMSCVFQPNNDTLHYLVRRRFEDMLGNLFALGAFAGDTQEESFRVVTDRSVNPPEMMEQGRFVVELRVAPSQPLAFLTVRLVQTGGEIVLAEEL